MDTKQNNENDGSQRLWLETAVGLTVVAGAFMVLMSGMLLFNWYRINQIDTVGIERLDNLKAQSKAAPQNEQLLEKVRRTDLSIRGERLYRQTFIHRGGLLLGGCFVVFLFSVRWAISFKKKVPHPESEKSDPYLLSREATLTRWSVLGVLSLLFLTVLLAATQTQPDAAAMKAELNEPEKIPKQEQAQKDLPVTQEQQKPEYATLEEVEKNWPSFRGPHGSGVSAYTNIPTQWDIETGQNILWKSEIPINSYNSPIIWDNRIFLSGANDEKRQVYCYDLNTGNLLWTRDVPTGAQDDPELMEDTGYAAPTMTTDGRHVAAIFATGDVACFDFEGNQVWTKFLGVPDNMYGYASSLAMYQNKIFVQFDQGYFDDDLSVLYAYDGATGNTDWKVNRKVANTWASPIVVRINDTMQLITCADPYTTGYNAATGEEIWKAESVRGDVAPSPIYTGGLVIVTIPWEQVAALKPEGTGDITESAEVWTAYDGVPDICSPLSDGDVVYFLATHGTLNCYDLQDGTKIFEQELEESFNASPSLVGDKVYIPSLEGNMFIFKAGREFEQIAKVPIGEKIQASPAFVDGKMVLRGEKHLICIGEK